MQTVYGDLLFFVNFCMDFQCLFLTAKLLRRPFFVWRSVFSAMLGALYACVALFFVASGGIALVLDLGVCALMCAMAFCTKGQPLSRLPVPFGVYFGVSFAVGGVMSGMASLLSHLDLPLQATEGEVSSLGFFLLAAIGGLCTFLWGRFCQRRAGGARGELTVVFDAKVLSVRGLVDTANLLVDPVGGRSVVILERRCVQGWLPPELCDGNSTQLADLCPNLAKRVRMIPTKTVTGTGLLLSLVPDSATLDLGRGPVPVEVLISVAPLDGIASDCQALLPVSLLTE